MRTGKPSLTHVAAGLTKTVGILAVATALLTQSTAFVNAAEKYAAFIIDANNGKVLFSKNADDERFPASLTKMMTLYLMFEAIEGGRASLTSPMKVSSYASARPPSKIGLKPGSSISVEDGILSLVTKSANDVAVVIGEYLGGSEERFAQMMTAKARQLGMSRTVFRNANGLPNPNQHTTARDMATLGMALREHFPREYKYFSTKSFNFRGRTIGNHNRLLGRVKGVDGIKTGYVNASGFNLVSSVLLGDKKLVGVVMGGTSGPSRDNHMAELLNKYIPLASTRRGAPLVAEKRDTGSRVVASAAVAPEPEMQLQASYTAPSRVPVPRMRETIEERIAAAYGSDAGDAIARISPSEPEPIVGREALRAALVAPRPMRTLQLPRVTSGRSDRPVPRGEIPGGADFDPETTGSIQSRTDRVVSSGWVVQIAAMPDKDRAMDMLAEAKAKGGAALAGATAFTEAVGSGSQTLHRARFAGFQSRGEASDACTALKKRSYNCYALAN